MKPRTRARTPSSIASNQSSKSKPSAATAASFVVSLVMAWSPFQRANAGIIWVEQPGDYANPIPTTAATGPRELHSASRETGIFLGDHFTPPEGQSAEVAGSLSRWPETATLSRKSGAGVVYDGLGSAGCDDRAEAEERQVPPVLQ